MAVGKIHPPISGMTTKSLFSPIAGELLITREMWAALA